jgi:hypothetical protein
VPAEVAEGTALADVDAGVALELELEPELHAAIPVTTQAANAIAPHRRVPVKRTIAPFRLSAVNDFSGLAPTLRPAAVQAVEIDTPIN